MIVAPIHIKHVHSGVSYQWAIYQKYDQRGHESPSGYGPLLVQPMMFHNNALIKFKLYQKRILVHKLNMSLPYDDA